MDPKKFDSFFKKVSAVIVVSDLAKETTTKRTTRQINSSTPMFDALDLFEKDEEIFISDNYSIKRSQLMNHPIKMLFYLLVIQTEYQLYKVLKNAGMDAEELHIMNFNDLTKNLLDIGSFRNVIMHTARKLKLDSEYLTVIHRKHQLLRTLNALNEILYKQ